MVRIKKMAYIRLNEKKYNYLFCLHRCWKKESVAQAWKQCTTVLIFLNCFALSFYLLPPCYNFSAQCWVQRIQTLCLLRQSTSSLIPHSQHLIWVLSTPLKPTESSTALNILDGNFSCWKLSGSITSFSFDAGRTVTFYFCRILCRPMRAPCRGLYGLSVIEKVKMFLVLFQRNSERMRKVFTRGEVEGRGRVRGELQGAISAEKWEWKGWKPINENQYAKAGRHTNWGGGGGV